MVAPGRLAVLARPAQGATIALLRQGRRVIGRARWGVEVAVALQGYLTATVPVRRLDEHTAAPPGRGAARRLPPAMAEHLQRASHGVGPLYLRRYQATIAGAQVTPTRLMRMLRADVNAALPSTIAAFEKTRGRRGRMRLGDEYRVHHLGPWDSRVRVVACDATSFRLATLPGHMEAGEITFSSRQRDGAVTLTIESWARSGDRLFQLLYDRLTVAREAQFHMWSQCCARAAELSGGRLDGPVTVLTRRHDQVGG